jgi:DNA-binding transcriptional MerR regulator/methylmalonyl-CoA mutase cobalamin-binding subunit
MLTSDSASREFTMPTKHDATEDLLSIGDLAEATGISTDTIRVWERRYGKPKPVRLASGHRRYTPDHVRWVRRIAEALARGYRPSKVIPLDEAEISRLLETTPGPQKTPPLLGELLALVQSYDGSALRRRLGRMISQQGPVDFFEEMAVPLVRAVGRAWADGVLEIRHEHFLSEILEDQLRTYRTSLPQNPDGSVVVLTTLEGETHRLGVQMAAVICVLADVIPHVLGMSTPNPEIAKAAIETRAKAVAITVSLATGGIETDRTLGDLRAQLDSDVRLVIGGMGARGVRRGPRHVEYVDSFRAFDKWLRDLAPA